MDYHMSIKRSVSKAKDLIRPLYYRIYRLPLTGLRQKRVLKEIRRKKRASVVFFVSCLPMWKAQGVYELLAGDRRFSVNIVFHPFATFSVEEQNSNRKALMDYFKDKGIELTDLSGMSEPDVYLRKRFAPDIIFYPQPYDGLFDNRLDNKYFRDRLLALIHYSFNSLKPTLYYSQGFSNSAWRLFYTSESDKQSGEEYSFNKGKNIRVVGNTNSDLFLQKQHRSVWKESQSPRKRIIWAPHFSITGNESWLHRNSFIALHEKMLEIAEAYKDSIQFAFKPHPRLITELYKHPEWGAERTDNYLNKWALGENTQLETGNYIDLFMTSDAMIHDCGSFSIEYLYSQKPVLFITEDAVQTSSQMNELGQEAFEAHYIGCSVPDIISFIDNTVLGGNDPLREKRIGFFNRYLIPPDGKSVAESIYEELINSVWP